MTDDYGWNGTSALMDPNVPGSKSDYYQTPNLEALAASGMRFSNGYAPTSMCSPTRAAMLTGKSPAQLQQTELKDAQPGTVRYMGQYTGLPLTPPTPEFFDPTELTMPRIVKQANPNYTTGLIGKWHLDVPDTVTPIASGYDYFRDVGVHAPTVDPWGLHALANEAKTFMSQAVAANKPFFMQYAPKAPHPPIYAKPEVQEKYENLPRGVVHRDPAYAAMVEHLDDTIGEVLASLQDLGVADNTYIIFTSDHGAGINFSSNAPLRGGKSSIYEGGLRVPYIVSGPGIAPNTFSEVPVTTTDIFSTVAAWAGYDGPTPEGVESADLNVVLQNGGVLPQGVDHLTRQFHDGGEIYIHQPQYMAVSPTSRIIPASAVRDGDFKLYVQYGENGSQDKVFLYNLKTDIGETLNLANQMPGKAAELKLKLDNYLTAVDASFAYDVKTGINLSWNAGEPGADSRIWRSTTDVDYKARESWTIGVGSQAPARTQVDRFQPGLPTMAFSFDGNDGMNSRFFHVSDPAPRTTTLNPGTPDFDRSMTAEVWFRLDDMQTNKVLLESGDGTKGMSLTLGDADGSGSANDLRFRVLGASGESLTLDVPIDRYADPTRDFIHATAVFRDSDDARYLQLYVNGALAGQINGQLGSAHSLQWDGYDRAGLGNLGGDGLGGAGGSGPLPFSGGGFRGDIAAVNFSNLALSPSNILASYNSALAPVTLGITSLGGGATTLASRPGSVSRNSTEAGTVRIFHERSDQLNQSLTLDAQLSANALLRSVNMGTPGELAAGTSINSYLVHLDPVGESGNSATVTGVVTFSQVISGVLFEGASLAATDAVLGSIGDYGMEGDRGLELTGVGATGDFLKVSSDRRTLSFRITSSGDAMQQFRVLTGAGSPGDFNGDGFVDANDLNVWKTAAGVSALGDANGDGTTDGADFLVWQRHFGAGAAGASSFAIATAAIPEPSSVAIAIFGVACIQMAAGRSIRLRTK